MEGFEYCEPMKAKLSSVEFLEQVSDDEGWVCGEKLDGYREVLYLGKERNELFSSLGNSHLDRVPQFKPLIPSLAGTVLDCEGMSPTRRLEDNASCFKSDPPNAIAWQEKHGLARLVVFDVLRLRGVDVMGAEFRERRLLLEQVFSVVSSCFPVFLERLVFRGKLEYYKRVVERTQEEGHEGVILKRMDGVYRPGMRGSEWLKVKRMEQRVYEIINFLPGVGKFEGMVGSVVYGIEGKPIGSASGMDDEVRKDMTMFPDYYLGHQAHFECQEITSQGCMRHPRWKGLV